MAIAPTVLVHT